jgi:hypothetical protein
MGRHVVATGRCWSRAHRRTSSAMSRTYFMHEIFISYPTGDGNARDRNLAWDADFIHTLRFATRAVQQPFLARRASRIRRRRGLRL